MLYGLCSTIQEAVRLVNDITVSFQSKSKQWIPEILFVICILNQAV
jgi:hypothetical protein